MSGIRNALAQLAFKLDPATAWPADWAETVREGAHEIGRLEDEITRLKIEGVPGQMHAVDQAFYRLTVLQRDLAWSEVEALRELAQIQKERIEALENPEPELPQSAEPALHLMPCPYCGTTEYLEINWVDVSTSMEPYGHQMIPGTIQCRNPECSGPVPTGPEDQT